MNVAYRKDPRIVSHDDAAAIHQEVGYIDPATGIEVPYDHCIRVSFAEPFAAYKVPGDDPAAAEGLALEMYEQRADEYEAAKVAYEAFAVTELGIELKEPYTFDWRDEQELWIRYND